MPLVSDSWISLLPVDSAYRRILDTRPYFFLIRWEWFEWLGIVGPAVILAWFGHIARKRKLQQFELLCRSLLIYVTIFFAAGLILSVPALANLAKLQPLRSLHLLYILLFLFGGALIGKFLLHNRAWRWALLFLPLCTGMWFAQRQIFPGTAHLEWPWIQTSNPWVQAFEWIQTNTPKDAYFTLDPQHMNLPGEDEQGFRAIAQRSMLADEVKDSGAASMFPAIASEWEQQVEAQKGWKQFQVADFDRLKRRYGVNWIVGSTPVAGLQCPYKNKLLSVCRLD